MDRLERLVDLLATLLGADRLLTAAEIAERVPGYPRDNKVALTRAFSRDKESLRAMEIPLVTEPIRPGDPEAGVGYRVPRERYELPDSGLAPDEVAALHWAITAVRLEGTPASEAIWKLGGVPAHAVVHDSARAALPGSEHLGSLFGALTTRAPVVFGYRGETREVEPWRLACRNGSWYVSGWDRGREGRRTFRVDRFDSAPELGAPGSFERPADVDEQPVPPWEMGDEEPREARILVDADRARWAVATVGRAAIAEGREDGSVVLVLRVTNGPALRTFVLGMLEHAELLSPPEDRAALRRWVEAVTARPA